MYIVRGDFAIDAETMKSIHCHILGSKDYHKWSTSIKEYSKIFEINMDKKILASSKKDSSSSFGFSHHSVTHFTVVLDNRKLSIGSVNK